MMSLTFLTATTTCSNSLAPDSITTVAGEYPADAVLNQTLDLFRRLGTSGRKRSNFIRNDCKPTT